MLTKIGEKMLIWRFQQSYLKFLWIYLVQTDILLLEVIIKIKNGIETDREKADSLPDTWILLKFSGAITFTDKLSHEKCEVDISNGFQMARDQSLPFFSRKRDFTQVIITFDLIEMMAWEQNH